MSFPISVGCLRAPEPRPLSHSVDVSKATEYLLHELDCDDWYVACHHDDLFVFHLTHSGSDRYAVCYQCTSPVEKGLHHANKARSMSVIPLPGGDNLREATLREMQAKLPELR